MSGNVLTGIAAFKARQKEVQEREASRNRPKANWFKIGDNESIVVRFLQEVDDEAEGYDEAKGLGRIYVEHNGPGPDGWKRHARCTNEDGQCFPCEQRFLDPKEWRQRPNFYINVLREDGTVEILTKNANSSFVQAVYEEAMEEGTITDKNFKITRSGAGTSTVWSLRAQKSEPFDVSGAEPWDLEEYVPNVPYDRQPKFFGVEAADEPVSTYSGGSGGNDGTAADW